jgi:acetyltransferase
MKVGLTSQPQQGVIHRTLILIKTPVDFSPVTGKIQDDAILTLRYISADDVDVLLAFVNSLSFGTRHFRYGRGDQECNRDRMLQLCSPNPRDCVHFLALKANDQGETVAASARILFKENAMSCEVAITVADAWQLHGIGKRLMDALLAQARAHHRTGMHGKISSINRRMIDSMRRRDFEINDSAEGASLKIARLVL